MTWNDDAVLPVAEALLAPQPVRTERVRSGGSTYVYRLETADACWYLRVLPEADTSFAPEAYAHRLLRAQGVRVPDAPWFEHRNAALDRSLMLTTAIAGQALGYGAQPVAVAAILRDAGRDLARINRVPVAGWGWIRRDHAPVDVLRAEHASFAHWYAHDGAPHVAAVRGYEPLAGHVAAVERALGELVERLQHAPTLLAHGDFDPTHIYHDRGAYSGIIDFGEMRGAPWLYDLGHFAVENGPLLPDLLAGYAEITPLPPDHAHMIALFGLLVAARRAGIWIARSGAPHPPDAAYIHAALEQWT